MPINVNYDPSLALAGQLAHDAGQGKFLQQEDQYNYETDRFDREYDLREEQFAESQDQYDETLAYNYDMAAQRGGQFQQQLDQQAYQYDAGLQSRHQLADQQQAAQAEYQEGQLEFQREGIEANQQMALTTRQAKIVQGHRDQMFKAAMSDATAIENYNFRLPEQKEQALQEWGKLHPGQNYPYTDLPLQQPAGSSSLERAASELKQAFGEMHEDGIENLFGTVQDGVYAPDQKMRPSAQAWLSLRRANITAATQREKSQVNQSTPDEITVQKSKAIVKQHSDWISAREKWVDIQLKDQVSRDEDSGYRGGSKQDLAGRFRLEYEERYSHTLPSPTTPAEFEALPPGARYRGSDGTVRTK